MGWLDLPRGTSYPTFPYNAMLFFPYEPFWGVKNKKILQMFFSLGYFTTPMTLFRHI